MERRRPRLLAHIGRWGRARRWLPVNAYRVLDVGCATGYGTAPLASGQVGRRWIGGLEPDARLAHDTARRYPWIPLVCGDPAPLPLRDGVLVALTLLVVLERFPHPHPA